MNGSNATLVQLDKEKDLPYKKIPSRLWKYIQLYSSQNYDIDVRSKFMFGPPTVPPAVSKIIYQHYMFGYLDTNI